MILLRLGEQAALSTAFVWAVSNHVNSAVGRMVGATGITLLRLPFQFFVLAVFCLLLQVSTPLSLEIIVYLSISGVTGMVIADFFLYKGILILGPVLGILILSLNAAFTAILGAIFLGEYLSLQAVGGMAVTTLGIFWVVVGRTSSILLPGQAQPKGKKLFIGVALLVASAFIMAVSYIVLKHVLLLGTPPLWAATVRLFLATVFIWGLGWGFGWSKAAVQSVRSNFKIFWLLLGSGVSSSVGLWFASVAVNEIPAGIAATIMGIQPIMVTLIGALWYRRWPSLQVYVGSIIAFLGTALMCLR